MEAVSSNLSLLRQRGISVTERRLAHIDDAARILAEMLDTERPIAENETFQAEYKSFVSSSFSDAELPDEVPEENRRRVYADQSEDAVNCGIFLCAAIIAGKKRRVSETELFRCFSAFSERPENAKIAYLRNPYSDTAYRIFSTVVRDAAVSYPRDFNSVCEEVYDGRCRYCILPIETSDEGTLSGFRRLTAKYELCPVLSCSVSSGGGSQTTRFGLFSKNIEKITVAESGDPEGRREIFSFRLNAPAESSILKAVKCIHLCGMRLLKVDSMPVSWDAGRYSLEFSTECGNGDLSAMMLYLTLEIPEYTPIGFYTQIEQRR